MPKRLSYKYIKEQIENVEGYKLLSKEYRNSSTKLELICSENHKFIMKWNDFQQGRRCPICYGNKKHTYEWIKEQINNKGYKLLSKEYNNSKYKLELQCPEGHEFRMKWNNFSGGQRCSICACNQKHSYEYIKEQIESVEGYKLLSKEYKDNRTKLDIVCIKSHKFRMNYDCFVRRKQRCSKCWKDQLHSKAEKEITTLVKSITTEIILENDRTQIINPKTDKNLELDIFIPSLSKAIEFNGEYWHSSEYSQYKDHQKKVQCLDKGIDLMVIEERNWMDDKSLSINKIKSFICK